MTARKCAANGVALGQRPGRRADGRRRHDRSRDTAARPTTSSSPTCSPGRWYRTGPRTRGDRRAGRHDPARRLARGRRRAAWSRPIAAAGFSVAARAARGDWTILRLRFRARHGTRAAFARRIGRDRDARLRQLVIRRGSQALRRGIVLRAARDHLVAGLDRGDRDVGLRAISRRAARNRSRPSRAAIRRSSG